MEDEGFLHVSIDKNRGQAWEADRDCVAIEEPLEIRLGHGPTDKRAVQGLSITMRTPGNDTELAVGFLVSEGIVRQRSDVELVRGCGPALSYLGIKNRDGGPRKLRNTVRVELAANVEVDLQRLERHFYTTSSCGVCGKTSLEALAVGDPPPLPADGPMLSTAAIHALPERLRLPQSLFNRTGGLHAAGLFDSGGNILALREDVGRHNAVDKLIGAEFLAGRLPLGERGILVSGRASFELMQKALMAGVPILAAVGAPSSLAVQLAVQFNMTLIGFLREGRFNVYSGRWRVR
jgi:FdhD protein